MTSPFLVTSADIRPLEVPSQLTSLFLSSSLTWSFTTKRTILYTWLSWQCHLKKTSRKLMIVRLRNIETLFLIFWIMDSLVIWLVLKLDHVASLPRGNVRNIDKIFSSVNTKPSKSFRKELNKVALLTSYTIWNARQEPAWGSENQPLLSAWFSFILALPSAFAGFISEFRCFSPAVVVFMFLCVYSPASKRALGSLLVLGLNVLPFVMHFALVVCIVWIKVDITDKCIAYYLSCFSNIECLHKFIIMYHVILWYTSKCYFTSAY